MKDEYTDSTGETTFDTRYRGQDVDLYVAGDNTIIARERCDNHHDADASEAGDRDA